MNNTELKPIIDSILSYYFNQKTRLQYDGRTQKEMINQNRGLVNACESVVGFSDNEKELVEYVKAKIYEINLGEPQEVIFKNDSN